MIRKTCKIGLSDSRYFITYDAMVSEDEQYELNVVLSGNASISDFQEMDQKMMRIMTKDMEGKSLVRLPVHIRNPEIFNKALNIG